MTELAKSRRNYVTIEQFYVAIELARVWRIYVGTEDFYDLIELATTESSIAHDRARRCVAIKEAMLARQTRSGAHDRDACTIEGKGSKELDVTTRLFLVATER